MNVEKRIAPGAITLSVMACGMSIFLTGYPGFAALAIGLFAGTVYFYIQREDKTRRLAENR